MARHRHLTFAWAALLLSGAANAQTWPGRHECARDLLQWGVSDRLPPPTGERPGDLPLARRRLEALRQRVGALRSRVVVVGTAARLRAWAQRLQADACALVPLVDQVARARDLALTTDALVTAGEGFEHVSDQLSLTPSRILVSPAERRALLEATAVLDAQARVAAPSPPPDPHVGQVVTFCPRGPFPLMPLTDLWFDESATADRHLAVSFFLTALAFTHGRVAMTRVAWHALDRVQDEANRPLIADWFEVRRSTLPAGLDTLLTTPSPGEPALETGLIGPPPLAR
jgi:hypothetical protein